MEVELYGHGPIRERFAKGLDFLDFSRHVEAGTAKERATKTLKQKFKEMLKEKTQRA